MKPALIVIFAILTISFGEQIVPIPTVVDGLLIGNITATFQLEAFIDLLCPDSQAAWHVLKRVINDTQSSGVSLRVHIFPLPYHDSAFTFARGASFFSLNGTANDLIKYIDFAFYRQNDY